MREKIPLAAIVAAFVLLSTYYSLAVPIWEAPDETEHFPSIAYIGRHVSLPTESLPSLQGTGGQSYQPPLYYALNAAFTFWIDASDYRLVRRNVKTEWDVPLKDRNIVVHTEDENFPYRGVILAMHIARFLSVLMGAATVILSYLIARQVVPGRRHVALGAAAITAFNPQFIFLSGAVNNGNLLTVLSSIALLAMVRTLKDPRRPTVRGAIVLGMLLGLQLLTKYNAFAFIPVTGIVLAIAGWRRSRIGGAIMLPAIAGVTATIFVGWWYLRNVGLYGHPFYRELFVTTGTPADVVDAVSQPDAFSPFWRTFQSYWAFFGWTNIPVPEPIYWLLAFVVVLAVLGVAAYGFGRDSVGHRLLLLVLVSAAACAFGLVALRVLTTHGTGTENGRFLFPAISAIAVILAIGLSHMRGILLATTSLGLVALSVLAVPAYISPSYYAPLPVVTDVSRWSPTTTVDIRFANGLRLIGIDCSPRRIAPGDSTEITLYWLVDRPAVREYVAFVHLVGSNHKQIAGDDGVPLKGLYPMTEWRVGEVIRDRRNIMIPADAHAGQLRVEVGQYEFPTFASVQREGGDDDQGLGFVFVEDEKIASLANSTESKATLDNVVELVDFAVSQRTAADYRTEIVVTLYWRATARLDRDLTAFVHVVDDKGQLIAQHDGPPDAGAFPTSRWPVGQVVLDEHRIEAASSTPNGSYHLLAGMYEPQSLKRLTASGSDADGTAGAVSLGEVVLP